MLFSFPILPFFFLMPLYCLMYYLLRQLYYFCEGRKYKYKWLFIFINSV